MEPEVAAAAAAVAGTRGTQVAASGVLLDMGAAKEQRSTTAQAYYIGDVGGAASRHHGGAGRNVAHNRATSGP